jgi:hypothetical protein
VTRTDDGSRTTDPYLLFAHEPYYPGPDTREINTTVVAAGTLLHPQVLQPDGARIHTLLTRGRRPGEIVPLSTLTHELNGGAGWPAVGDLEYVTTDIVRLVRTQQSDALSLGLPALPRALLCAGPASQVRAFGTPTDPLITYGPQDRAAVLVAITDCLTARTSGRSLWSGHHRLPPSDTCHP